ncbi:UDP-N-acetyl-D-mannosamine 6-dehydrogenase [Massarina eburnea CBS 473.64]|uniref:UDP-N-acetyl-D-mannosamine 6-dehydrogenase n=1 Tax=Massarina eburnea CBS 473.64 TaxID=1395130 RepID=A0A6A6S501_9PLEO|nr:UDP-N-acetyl-D-mannosamine 6-dehydrogenase [Massarina eburnea CBS 473.64]
MTYTRRCKDSSQTPCVCVVGVGYVGEALLREFGHVFKSIGFDISQKRVDELEKLFRCLPKVSFTTNMEKLGQATHYLISVPTPLKKDHSVNLMHLLSAVSMVLSYARPGSAIVIESSVCVGTTRQFFNTYKETYHCGMSPERVDPGRIAPTAKEIPKLVSGLTPKALSIIQSLYAQVFDNVVPVSSPETAEMTKLFENCQRMINIAYVNEVADAARTHGIDPDEMIRAASSKPYGFTPYSPGLGVGGNCIPVNPFYLFANNKNLPVLEKATAQMRKRPGMKARKFHARINSTLPDRSPRILIVGLGYKPGQSLLTSSPGLAFAERLRRMGCSRLAFYDPLVCSEAVEWMEKLEDDSWCPPYLEENFDAVAICMRQKGVDFGAVEKLQTSKVVVQEFR